MLARTNSRKRDDVPGALRVGDSVQVFSQSAGIWLNGKITHVKDDDRVRVEYLVGEDMRHRTMHVHSDDLRISNSTQHRSIDRFANDANADASSDSPGAFRVGDTVDFFYAHAGRRVEGEVVQLMGDGRVRVVFLVDERRYRKVLCVRNVARVVPDESISPVAKALAGKGFTVRQLLQFYIEKITDDSITTNDVVKKIVIPETAKDKSCYMESAFMKDRGGPQKAFKLVSHAWKSQFLNTVLNIILDAWECGTDKLEGYFKYEPAFQAAKLLKDLENPELQSVLDKKYWLCIFAVNEHKSICGDCWVCKPSTIEEFSAPFCKCEEAGRKKPKFNPCACGCAKSHPGDDDYEIDKFDHVVLLMDGGLVVSLDPKLETLERIWVVAEIGQAMKAQRVQFLLVHGLNDGPRHKLGSTFPKRPCSFCHWLLPAPHREPVVPEVKNCHATSDQDKDRILEKIDKAPGGQRTFNAFVWAMVELQLGVCHRVADLSDGALQSVQRLTDVRMNFSWRRDNMSTVADVGLVAAFTHLKNLRHLVMDFRGCKKLVDVSAIGHGLKELTALQHLVMQFHGCSKLEDVSAIGHGLKGLTALQHLVMDFCGCEKLVDVAAIGHGFKGLTALQHLVMHFEYCSQISDVSAIGHGLGGLTALQHLVISLLGFKRKQKRRFGDVSAIGHGLTELTALQHLVMRFDGCFKLEDFSAIGHGLKWLTALQHLDMFFPSTQISDVSAIGHGLGGLTALQHLFLRFDGCSKLEDLSAIGHALKGLTALQHLELDFGATQISDVSAIGHGLGGLTALQHLDLRFICCRKLEDVAAIGHGLKGLTALQHLVMKFNDCSQISDVSAIGHGLGGLTALQHLVMWFYGCKLEDVPAIGHGLKELTALQHLEMDFKCCSQISDVSAIGHGLGGLTALQHLVMCFSGCSKLEDVSAIGHGLK